MKAEIVTIGTELLLGEIDDTNATYLARKLSEIGVDLYYRTTVGDNEGRIAEVISHALDRVDIVITTGGLGPTVDDKTREAVAAAAGLPLEFNQALYGQIEERFRQFNVEMSDNNRQQAFIPQGAMPIRNPVGTAPIFALETPRGVVIVLPGVPREMKHLMENEIIPYLQANTEAPAVIRSLVLRTAGIGESQVDDRIGDLMRNANPTVGLAAHAGQTDVRVTAKASSPAEADAMIAVMVEELRKRLGSWIYGTGSLPIEAAVARLLAEQGATVAAAEVGTGGLLGKRLTEAAADALAFSGVYEAVADVPSYDADLPLGELAKRVASAVRDEHEATYALTVLMRGEEQPEGAERGTEIAVALPERSIVRTFNWLNDRPDAPIWATTHAIAMLRRVLLAKDSAAEEPTE